MSITLLSCDPPAVFGFGIISSFFGACRMECFFPQCLGERGDVAALRRRAVVAEAEVAKLRAQIEHLHDHAVSSGDAHARGGVVRASANG